MTKKALLVAFLAILCGGLYAQEYRATLTGTVTDPSGASVPNATVKATNNATNNVSETKTTSDGVYTLPLLEPGQYRVEAVAPGFQTLSRTSITLAVGQRLNINLQLTVGQATTEITVTGQQEVIDSADASRGLVFDPIKTQEYPLNGRQSYMLLSLTPGVIFTSGAVRRVRLQRHARLGREQQLQVQRRPPGQRQQRLHDEWDGYQQ